MKRTVFVSLWLAVLPGMLAAQSVDDDLYYIPKKGKQKTTTATVSEPVKEVKVSTGSQVNVWAPNASTVIVRDRKGSQRDVDEYNRRYSAKENNFSVQNDTLYIDEREDSDLQGEWINGFEGTQDDYEYAVRLIRFRNPRYAIPVSSPLYWDVVYAQTYSPWDWNVYDDGLYAYIFPTFSNRLWWDWRYNSYGPWGWSYWSYAPYYSWSWSWGWNGWYDPFYHPHYWYAHGPAWGWRGGHWGRPAYRPSYRPSVAQRGHDREGRFNSGTRYSGTRTNGSTSNRYSGTRVNGSNGQNPASGRFNGVQGYRSTGGNGSASVRPSANGTRSGSGENVNPSGVRSTSSYIRPNSTRSTSNTYSRPSSTRSTRSETTGNNNSYRRTESNYSRSHNTGTSVRSSGFNSGGGSRSVGTGGSSSRSGGGHSRR